VEEGVGNEIGQGWRSAAMFLFGRRRAENARVGAGPARWPVPEAWTCQNGKSVKQRRRLATAQLDDFVLKLKLAPFQFG
jgi:hypothetical protein